MRTSISDLPHYRDFCRHAANDDAAFVGFREDPSYRWVVSSDIPHDARDFYAMLEERNFDFGFFDGIRDLDRVGGPRLLPYERAGLVAPQTMRYVKAMSDIERLFGSLDGKSVVEIGAGFGGQCAVLSRRFRLARYTLLDLPEPLMVARRYLEAVGAPDVACVADLHGLAPTAHDLVISAYGLSEVARPFQIEYVNRVLRWARSGYLLWNSEQMRAVPNWHRHNYGGDVIYADEMLSLMPDARILGQEWLSVSEREYGTAMMVWGTG
ncbi:MAG TPA: putative sugar O-methyltransferase [Candidatus Sulfotelmatobacter sp.]|nr:putative sugar O-methyltransferase [Candidatus Sulfotelmatobacter sp.]